MSNCFDPEPNDALASASFVARLSRLLAAIADELASAADEVVRLGETMSDNAAKPERPDARYDLQAFDLFAQTAHAQARLLKRLARGDAGQSREGIAALIEEVPFARVRQRLSMAAYGPPSETPAIEEPDDSEISWF